MPGDLTGAAFGPRGYSLIIAMIIALTIILLRNRQARRLRVELLWIRPVIFTLIMGAGLVATPPALTPLAVVIMLGGLALGCALGWQRGRLMHIEVDPETHMLRSQASPLGLIFIVVLLVARFGLRTMTAQYAQEWHLPLIAVGDAFLLFVVGLLAVQALEMWLRAQRLLTEARAGGPTSA